MSSQPVDNVALDFGLLQQAHFFFGWSSARTRAASAQSLVFRDRGSNICRRPDMTVSDGSAIDSVQPAGG